MSTLNADDAGGLGSNTKSTKADHASKPSSSGANTEYDSHIMLLNFPQEKLCLLCSMLAREWYVITTSLHFSHYMLNHMGTCCVKL